MVIRIMIFIVTLFISFVMIGCGRFQISNRISVCQRHERTECDAREQHQNQSACHFDKMTANCVVSIGETELELKCKCEYLRIYSRLETDR